MKSNNLPNNDSNIDLDQENNTPDPQTNTQNMASDKGNTLSTGHDQDQDPENLGYDTTQLLKYLDNNDFNDKQKDIVMDILNTLVPHLADEMLENFKQENHLQRLEQHFGDPKRWQVIRSQLKKWGKANLDPKTYNALASSFDGILSMHKLMTGDSNNNTIKTGKNNDSSLTEDQLLQMMKDPKYWKTKDPQFIAKVKEGFQKIYD